jgi:hypothetical protein
MPSHAPSLRVLLIFLEPFKIPKLKKTGKANLTVIRLITTRLKLPINANLPILQPLIADEEPAASARTAPVAPIHQAGDVGTVGEEPHPTDSALDLFLQGSRRLLH